MTYLSLPFFHPVDSFLLYSSGPNNQPSCDIFSTMSTPSFNELSFVPFLNMSALIITTFYVQCHLILRPTMFPFEQQVVLLESFLDFIHGCLCWTCSSIYLNFLHNTAILSWYTCQYVSDLAFFIKYMIKLLKLVYVYGQ